jgi:glycosyltransferase involved in cell wall biosynthesis
MINVHVIYEHSGDNVPHGSSMIRLLRPLSHPTLRQSISLSSGSQYMARKADVIIIDRLWKKNVKMSEIEHLVAFTKRNGIKLIYSIDDNLLDLNNYAAKNTHPNQGEKTIVRYLLRESDAILVSTTELYNRFLKLNNNIYIIENSLDERLILPMERKRENKSMIKIGYMGTLTHDSDYQEILPAIRKILYKYRSKIKFEFAGALSDDRFFDLQPNSHRLDLNGFHEYTKFWGWMNKNIHWDFALAPLKVDEFTKCKSDIKFLDYAALNIAGIFTRSPAYETSVVHNKTGLLVENETCSWIEALETLIIDKEMRLELAENARHYLYSYRILGKNATKWENLLSKICGSL